MSKDPAFLFYSSDFLTGTMFFSDEQIGRYIKLLCAQHQKGRLNKKDMLNICKTYDKDIFDKFKIDKNGLYYNERLENEIIRRKKYSESRRKNRLNKQELKNISKTYDKHMETETETETENRTKNKIIFPFDSEIFKQNWIHWKEYKKKEFNFKYKSAESEQAVLKKLSNLSNSDEKTAIEIIHQSLENGWKGLFELKDKNNGQFTESKARSEAFRKHYPGYDKL